MASAQIHERTLARRSALQVLYMTEMLEKSIAEVLLDPLSFKESVEDTPYMYTLLECIQEHDNALQYLLAQTSKNWALSRMPIVDRCILRIASCEMLYIEDIPISVAINEAVELAKSFGGEDDSHRFVNGILGKIALSCEEKGDVFLASIEKKASELSSEVSVSKVSYDNISSAEGMDGAPKADGKSAQSKSC